MRRVGTGDRSGKEKSRRERRRWSDGEGAAEVRLFVGSEREQDG